MDFKKSHELDKFLELALEASFYASPRDPGLTYSELFELASRNNILDGEFKDTLSRVERSGKIEQAFRSSRIFLNVSRYHPFYMFWYKVESKKMRDLDVLHVIFEILISEIRKISKANFSYDSEILKLNVMEKTGCSEHTYWVNLHLAKMFKAFSIAGDGQIIKPGQHLTIQCLETIHKSDTSRKEEPQLLNLLVDVNEIISRRKTEQTISTDPLRSFEELLPKISAEKLSMWWLQGIRELSFLDPNKTPVQYLVRSASLLEASLLVTAVKAKKVGLIGEKALNGEPKNWKIFHLLKVFSSEPTSIYDQPLKDMILQLNEDRRIIHAGVFCKPDGSIMQIPEIKREQAIHSKIVLEKALRALVEWIQNNFEKLKVVNE